MKNLDEFYTEELKSSELIMVNGGEVEKDSFGYFLGRLVGEMVCAAKTVLEVIGPKPLK